MLDDEIDALYALPPADFIDARKALAARTKKAGDAAGAARVLSIAKPTLAAWAVNQLYREATAEFAELMAAGASLREAHRRGASGVREVFAAQQAQRAAVDVLVRAARALLERNGLPATDATLGRVGETLTSISTRHRWGDAKPGQLSRELPPLGFDALLEVLGDEEITSVAQVTSPAPPKPAKASKIDKAAEARRQAEIAVAEARREKENADHRAERAHRAAESSKQSARDAELAARRWADALKTAEEAFERAKRAANEAASEASAAIDRADAARSAADEAARASEKAAEHLRRAEARLESLRR